MKVLHLLFIFILNFKLIFCQNKFPSGKFLIRNSKGELLGVEPDTGTVSFSRAIPGPNLNSNLVWIADGGILFNGDIGRLALSVDGEKENGASLIVRPPIGFPVDVWVWFIVTDDNKGLIKLDDPSINLIISSDPSGKPILINSFGPPPPSEYFTISPAFID